MYWAWSAGTIPTLYTVNKKGENAILADSLFQTPHQLNPNVPVALSNLVMESSPPTPASARPTWNR